jgi:hypothetical protein
MMVSLQRRVLVIAGLTLALAVFAGGFVPSQFALAQTEDPPQDPPAIEVEIQFGTDIDRETRSLVDAGTVFPPEVGKVFCWTRVVGAPAATTITHAWYHEGQTMARVDLNVGAGHFRTWSSKNVLASWTGNWEVKVLDDVGTVLATAAFEIK